MSRTQFKNLIVGMESPQSGANRDYNYAQALNGGLDFGQSTETDITQATGNMKGQWVNVTAPAVANTEFSIPHSLGYVPSHLPVINKDRACDVYQLPNTGTPWTATHIFVKCSVANAVLRIFVQ